MRYNKVFKKWSIVFLVWVFLIPILYSGLRAQDLATKLADHFLNKIPVTQVDSSLTMEEAMKVQERFILLISKEFGTPVGYKAGLTNPVAQQAFGVNHPIRGTLLQKMLLKSGVTMDAKFGIRPISEGDLLVRVGNEAINEAKTLEEVLKNLDAVIPFIELPDLVYDPQVKLNAPAIAAINVGARYGVMGEAIPLVATVEWMERLKNFTLQIYDEKGNLLTEGKGSSLLGNPLAVALWIKESLSREGKRLKKGDLLSLGSIGKMIPVKPDTTLCARYIDLDPKGPVEVCVTFK